jgi:hypothetical protein
LPPEPVVLVDVVVAVFVAMGRPDAVLSLSLLQPLPRKREAEARMSVGRRAERETMERGLILHAMCRLG